MTNLTRVTGKIFGETASTSNTPKEIGQFGSAKAGTYNATGDVATIQNLSAWSNGWIDAVTPTQQFPSLPEMTGVHKVLSYQNAYLLQKGVAEWDSGTTYYTGDFCKGVGEGKLYVSKVDSNTNHAVTDGNYWEEFSSGSSRNIGEIVASTIPLTDAGLHLLDGALLQYGSYQAFIDYIADLYDSGDYPDLFDTEANWQTAVTTYGICNKFVYDSVNNTVRLPKWGSQIITKAGTISTASTVPVKGTGKAMGVTNGTDDAYLAKEINSGSYFAFAPYPTGGNAGDSCTWTSTIRTSYGNKLFGLNTDSTKTGIVADISSIKNYPLDCYYYIVIATSTKTQIQVDIDEIATDLNGKADTDLSNVSPTSAFATAMNTAGIRTVVETYVNGASWYRVYSDKWCEQGGNTQTSSTVTVSSITFLKQFSNTNYTIIALTNAASSTGYTFNDIDDKTVSSCVIRTSTSCYGHNWYACGYIN